MLTEMAHQRWRREIAYLPCNHRRLRSPTVSDQGIDGTRRLLHSCLAVGRTVDCFSCMPDRRLAVFAADTHSVTSIPQSVNRWITSGSMDWANPKLLIDSAIVAR